MLQKEGQPTQAPVLGIGLEKGNEGSMLRHRLLLDIVTPMMLKTHLSWNLNDKSGNVKKRTETIIIYMLDWLI